MRSRITFNFYVFTFLLLFLQTMHVWFLWGDFFKIVCPVLFLFAAINNHSKNFICYYIYHRSINTLFLCALLIISLYQTYDAGVLSVCRTLVGLIVFYELLQLSKETGEKLMSIITKCIGLISMVSLIGWIIFLSGFSLPNSDLVDTEFGYIFDNYYIFLYNRLGDFPRFCSVFLEPGYYGQIAAVILYANKMRLNNIYTVSIFISALFSLSLAGYILIALGFLFTYMKKDKIYVLFIVCGIGFLFYKIVIDYNDGDNPVNDLIVARLEIEDGKLVGDDRSTYLLDKYYSEGMYRDGNYLFGMGSSFSNKDWGHGVAGYKAYVVERGFVGLILTIISYFILLYRISKPTSQMFFCFILFMAMYWQAAYPYWVGFFSIYLFSLSTFTKSKERYPNHYKQHI